MSLRHHVLFPKEEAHLDVANGDFREMNPCPVHKLFLQQQQLSFYFNRKEHEKHSLVLTAQNEGEDVIYFLEHHADHLGFECRRRTGFHSQARPGRGTILSLVVPLRDVRDDGSGKVLG